MGHLIVYYQLVTQKAFKAFNTCMSLKGMSFDVLHRHLGTYTHIITHLNLLQPNPREPLLEWADIRSGSRTKFVQPWEDATSCIFSGCYESGPEMRYRTYWIQNFTCSVNRGEETAVNVANGSVRLALQKELIRKKILAVCMTHNNAGAGKLDGDANVTLATVFGMAFLFMKASAQMPLAEKLT